MNLAPWLYAGGLLTLLVVWFILLKQDKNDAVKNSIQTLKD